MCLPSTPLNFGIRGHLVAITILYNLVNNKMQFLPHNGNQQRHCSWEGCIDFPQTSYDSQMEEVEDFHLQDTVEMFREMTIKLQTYWTHSLSFYTTSTMVLKRLPTSPITKREAYWAMLLISTSDVVVPSASPHIPWTLPCVNREYKTLGTGFRSYKSKYQPQKGQLIQNCLLS